ncbi:MAG: hypothetical protein A2X49_00975 [Lentisphaerae bacterium GWF2_52_8]|nr:MAG: hypothetical protein A2X49_00975 [Lentisphaerae bacterium GWF2_52_8]
MVGGWTTLAAIIALLSREANIYVICLFGRGPIADELEAKGIKIYFFNFKIYNLPIKFLQLLFFLKKHKIDIVHTNLHLSHIIGQSAAMFAGTRKIIHMHSLEKAPRGLIGWWKSFLVQKADMVIPVSQASLKAFQKAYPLYKNQVKVIYNGVDIAEIRKRCKESKYHRAEFGVEENAFLIISVANLKWEKGLIYLIAGAQRLPPSIHFLIVGDGPQKTMLKEEIEKAKLSERFHFLGQRRDIPELLSLANAFVLPSVVEGFGISLLEALAVGLPSIASNVGGIPEMFSGQELALLVPPANPEKLADAISMVHSDAELRKKLSENSEQSVKNFDIHLISKQYYDVYMELIENS